MPTKKVLIGSPHSSVEMSLSEDMTVSDGYHTFDELYDHRCLLFLLAVKHGVFKATSVTEDHYPGWDLIHTHSPCGYGDREIYQQISYHVPSTYRPYYDVFPRRTKDEAEASFDGHQSRDVIERLKLALLYTLK